MTYSSYIALRDPMKGWGVGPDREGAQLANLDIIIISRSRRSKSVPKMLPLILNPLTTPCSFDDIHNSAAFLWEGQLERERGREDSSGARVLSSHK